MLAQIKWLLFLLIFSLLARVVATQAATAEGRIFVTSVANVFIIVAAGWLLVRLTKLVARLKTQQLRQIGLPGKIAAVELSSWLLVCVWFTAGLFLILRSLGIELTAVIAGLGIGGIAFAFAAQKTIENLFGTVTVVADEAIQVGDHCQAGDYRGPRRKHRSALHADSHPRSGLGQRSEWAARRDEHWKFGPARQISLPSQHSVGI